MLSKHEDLVTKHEVLNSENEKIKENHNNLLVKQEDFQSEYNNFKKIQELKEEFKGMLTKKIVEEHSVLCCITAISNNKVILVVGLSNGAIKLWSLEDNSLLSKFKNAHDNYVWCLAYLNINGVNTLFSGSGDKTIKLWNINNFKPLKTIKAHEGCIRSLITVSIGKENFLISGGDDFYIKIWDSVKGDHLNTFVGHQNIVYVLKNTSINNKSEVLISGSRDRSIKIWNFPTGILSKSIDAHNDRIRTLMITNINTSNKNNSINSINEVTNTSTTSEASGTIKVIISGSDDRSIKIWNMETYELINFISGAHENAILIFKIFKVKNRELLISGGRDKSLKLWDIDNGELCLVREIKAHNDFVYDFTTFIQNFQNSIVSVSEDKTIKFWI